MVFPLKHPFSYGSRTQGPAETSWSELHVVTLRTLLRLGLPRDPGLLLKQQQNAAGEGHIGL